MNTQRAYRSRGPQPVVDWLRKVLYVVVDWFRMVWAVVGDWFRRTTATVTGWVRQTTAELKARGHSLLYQRRVRNTLYWLHHFSLPGTRGVPLYDVLSYFLVSIFNGNITQRAKGLAYSFLTALPPLLIFFFTLVAYLPFDGVQDELLDGLAGIVPAKILAPLSNTVDDVMGHRHSTLLSVGFISSVLLAANGMNGIIMSLNFANQGVEKRSWLGRYALCVMLVFVLYVLVVLVLGLLIGHKQLLQLIFSQGWLSDTRANNLLFNVGRWVLLSLATLMAVSFIYYFAPAKRQRVGFFSAGSVLATGMFFVLSWGLGLYLNNFSRYNILYGSIGTLLMVMFWVYFNCIVILVGYELNISIFSGTVTKKNAEQRRQLRERLKTATQPGGPDGRQTKG